MWISTQIEQWGIHAVYITTLYESSNDQINNMESIKGYVTKISEIVTTISCDYYNNKAFPSVQRYAVGKKGATTELEQNTRSRKSLHWNDTRILKTSLRCLENIIVINFRDGGGSRLQQEDTD